jgi:hypothetical protein
MSLFEPAENMFEVVAVSQTSVHETSVILVKVSLEIVLREQTLIVVEVGAHVFRISSHVNVSVSRFDGELAQVLLCVHNAPISEYLVCSEKGHSPNGRCDLSRAGRGRRFKCFVPLTSIVGENRVSPV